MDEHPWRTTPGGGGDVLRAGTSDGAGTADRGPRGRRPGAPAVLAACAALVVGLLGGLGIGTAVASSGPTGDGTTSSTSVPGQGVPGGQGGPGSGTSGGGAGPTPGGPPPGGAPGAGTTSDGAAGAVSDPVTYVVRTTASAGGPGDVPPPHAAAPTGEPGVVERRYDV
ncbi:hypothetical protein WDZ17_02205 [Pseudokineococcus basanitobsidens]|uniref:Uncharacterized protein n=1 Tax=Pseudokineococcus basanitobsidens TaxID=1926649 RepID=A0ABU8RGA6_9ACTN